MIWRCPKCFLPLSDQTSNLVCAEGHVYDRAKQGYTNLLLANQKNSREPGDNDEMISARRQFLRAGYYEPLVEAIAQLVIQNKKIKSSKKLTVLDLGCGEGYYLESILGKVLKTTNALECFDGYGLDISKTAIKKAASSAKQFLHGFKEAHSHRLNYVIASNANAPAVDASADIILTVFAPIVASEISRVLATDGTFIRVAPGPRHLQQLRSIIYSKVDPHQAPSVGEGLVLEREMSVQFEINLNSPESIEQLLAMTPFNWNGKAEAKKAIIEGGVLLIEADFLIQICSKVQL